MNEKREQLNQIELRDKVSLVIVPNPHMHTPAYTLRRIRDDEKELPENTAASYQIAEQPSVDDSNIGTRDKKPQGDIPLVPSILPASAAPIIPMPEPVAPVAPVAPTVEPVIAAPQVGIFVKMWRFFFGTGAPKAAGVEAAAAAAPQTQRDRPASRDVRHDRYRNDRDRNRPDRDRHRDVRRDGPRDPRRDRPRSESGSGPRRPDGAPSQDRSAGPRSEAARPDAGRPDAGRPDTGRPDQAPRAEGSPRPDQGQRPDAARPDSGPRQESGPRQDTGPRGESAERSGRSRRRRGRGRGRDAGGESSANGANPGSSGPVSNSPVSNGSAPNGAASIPAPSAPAQGSVESAPRDVPAPGREPSQTSGTSNDNKYVVWSSAPSEVQRSEPDER
jgi:ribonuclease E